MEHNGRMIRGLERWAREVFTPPVDIAFAVIITIAAFPGLLSWRRYSGGRAGRAVYAFAILMLLVSVPLHFRTLFTRLKSPRTTYAKFTLLRR